MITVKEDCHCEVSGQLAEIMGVLNDLTAQIQSMRRERLPSSPEAIEALIEALYIVFADAPFAVAWVLEESIGRDEDSKKLLRAMKEVLPQPTVKRLSTLLKQSTGTFNDYRLQIVDPHSRAGAMFRVINVTNYVTT